MKTKKKIKSSHQEEHIVNSLEYLLEVCKANGITRIQPLIENALKAIEITDNDSLDNVKLHWLVDFFVRFDRLDEEAQSVIIALLEKKEDLF